MEYNTFGLSEQMVKTALLMAIKVTFMYTVFEIFHVTLMIMSCSA